MADPLAAVAALDGVAPAVQRSRRALDGLLGHRALRRSSATVAVEASLRSALAASALQDPAAPTGEEALDRLRDRLRAGREPEGAALRGAVRVSAEVGTLVATWERAPLQALARLHVVAAADVLPPADLGRPRGRGAGDDDLALPPPPPPDEVAARLDGLARHLAGPTAAPALVVAAVVHGEVLAVRPFHWGNVLVALAAARLVLVSRGLDPRSVSVPEAGHLDEGREAYVDAARGYAGGDLSAWVGHCARAVEVGAREGLAVCETVVRAG